LPSPTPSSIDAVETNATYRPFGEITGSLLAPRAWVPWSFFEMRMFLPVTRSRTNTSLAALVSPGTTCVATESNAT
jgi:hypothetical protein